MNYLDLLKNKHMHLNKKIISIGLISLLLLSMEVVLLLDNNMYIGKLISHIFPCQTPDGNSFPCY